MRDIVYRCEGNMLQRCYQTSDVYVLSEFYELFATTIGRKIYATRHAIERAARYVTKTPAQHLQVSCYAVEMIDSVVGNMRLVPEL